ncbi:unnamed protein product [Timema podura]|uniref:Uncharacterized protein n=1 Tax=Timema podura TaxID=61482 RepID=A0ABN7NRT3_TIMPD|nr:unnamed protein product [Timema podura]
MRDEPEGTIAHQSAKPPTDPTRDTFTPFITGTGCILNDITSIVHTSVTFIFIRTISETETTMDDTIDRYSTTVDITM